MSKIKGIRYKEEIKFRAWDRFVEKMWHWDEHNAFSTNTGSIKDWFCDHDLRQMQYIGIDDKFDVEVYEGDILAFTNNNQEVGIVEYEERKFVAYYLDENGDQDDILDYKTCCFEVIGNIYETPKLIPKPKK